MHDLFSKTVVDIREADTALDAARKMERTQVGSLMVVDENGKLVGMLTGRDLVLNVLAKDINASNIMVRDIMTSRPTSIELDVAGDIHKITKAMARARVRRLPILDGEGKPVGIVSLEDVLVKAADIIGNLGQVVAPYLTVARLQSAREQMEHKS